MLLDDLVTTILPAVCRCCAGPLERAGLIPVCDFCVQAIVPSDVAGCDCCGNGLELARDLEDLRFAGMLTPADLCRDCRLASPEFTRAVAYGTYSGELRTLIGLLKFHHLSGVARLLGGHMGQAILQLEEEAGPELTVIAVPLFRLRERQRGYNQSVLLADQALGWLRRQRPAWKLTAGHGKLVRRRRTESSFTLSPRGRRSNLRGAFAVAGEVAGREILLIDDILTSGATARECARVLIRAGASKVWVATLARAQFRTALGRPEDPRDQVAAWDLKARPEAEAAP